MVLRVRAIIPTTATRVRNMDVYAKPNKTEYDGINRALKKFRDNQYSHPIARAMVDPLLPTGGWILQRPPPLRPEEERVRILRAWLSANLNGNQVYFFHS